MNEQRPSGIVIGEPIGSSIGGRSRPYPRDESGPGIHSPILTKKVKTEYGEVPKTEVPKNVISAVEEVKRKAKLSAVPANRFVIRIVQDSYNCSRKLIFIHEYAFV